MSGLSCVILRSYSASLAIGAAAWLAGLGLVWSLLVVWIGGAVAALLLAMLNWRAETRSPQRAALPKQARARPPHNVAGATLSR